jgi:hypothetical protein
MRQVWRPGLTLFGPRAYARERKATFTPSTAKEFLVRRLALPLGGPLVGLLGLGLVLGTGCSSSDSVSSSSTTRAPEENLVSNAKVVSGLAALQRLARTAATQAPTDAAEAKKTTDQLEPQWAKIEGRIKKNDADAYLAFEDALTDLKVGADDQDAAKVAKGATAVAAAAAAYLAKYPG